MRPQLFKRVKPWAENIVASRPPDMRMPSNADAYLLQWEVGVNGGDNCVFVHMIVEGPTPDLMHDHEWDNASIVVSGRYIEHCDGPSFVRYPGEVVCRAAKDKHRLELYPGETCITVWLTGDYAEDARHGCFDILERIVP